MEPDYPAAHSMDTCWFAVDRDGQIAFFRSGEPGHVPEAEDNDIFDALYALYFGKNALAENGLDWDEDCARLGSLDFFVCDVWDHVHNVAYLGTDGVTVRPIVGEEDQFADFAREFIQECPEEAARLRFEGPIE